MAPGVAKALPQARPAIGQHAAGAHGGSPVLDQATLRQLAKELVEPVLNALKPVSPQALAAAQQPSAGDVYAHHSPQPPTAMADTAPDHTQGSPPESAPTGYPPAKKRRVRVKVVLPPGEAGPLPPSSPPLHRAGPPHVQNANPFKIEEGSAEAMRWSSSAAMKKDMRGLQADVAGDLPRCMSQPGETAEMGGLMYHQSGFAECMPQSLLHQRLLQDCAVPKMPNSAQHLLMLAQGLGARQCGQCMIEACQDCPMAEFAELPRPMTSNPTRVLRAGEATASFLHRLYAVLFSMGSWQL